MNKTGKKILSFILALTLIVGNMATAVAGSAKGGKPASHGDSNIEYMHIDVIMDGEMTVGDKTYAVKITGVNGTVNGKALNFKNNSSDDNTHEDREHNDNEFRANTNKIRISNEIQLTMYCEYGRMEGETFVKEGQFAYTHIYTDAEKRAAADACGYKDQKGQRGLDFKLDTGKIADEVATNVTVHYYKAGTTTKIAEDTVYKALPGTVSQNYAVPVITGTKEGIVENHYSVSSTDVSISNDGLFTVTAGAQDKEVIIWYTP